MDYSTLTVPFWLFHWDSAQYWIWKIVIYWSCNLGNLTAKLWLSVVVMVTSITYRKSCLKLVKLEQIILRFLELKF